MTFFSQYLLFEHRNHFFYLFFLVLLFLLLLRLLIPLTRSNYLTSHSVLRPSILFLLSILTSSFSHPHHISLILYPFGYISLFFPSLSTPFTLVRYFPSLRCYFPFWIHNLSCFSVWYYSDHNICPSLLYLLLLFFPLFVTFVFSTKHTSFVFFPLPHLFIFINSIPYPFSLYLLPFLVFFLRISLLHHIFIFLCFFFWLCSCISHLFWILFLSIHQWPNFICFWITSDIFSLEIPLSGPHETFIF